jgi:hypothetical protein
MQKKDPFDMKATHGDPYLAMQWTPRQMSMQTRSRYKAENEKLVQLKQVKFNNRLDELKANFPVSNQHIANCAV